MKILKGLIFTLMLLGIMAGCSSGGDEGGESAGGEKEISFWAPFSGPDGPNMKKIVDKFNESQDEYTVNFQIKPNEDYYTTLDLALNDQKNVPDLFIVHADHLPTYADKDILKELDGITGDLVNPDNYNKNAWEGAKYNDKLYGIPLDVHPLIMYWNKKLFKEAGLDPEQPPTNREEFLKYAKALTNKEKGQYGFVVPTGGLQDFIFPTIVYQNGGQLMTDSNEVNYNSEPVIEALKFQRDLIEKYEVAPSDVQDSPTPLFLQQKAGMILNGPWMINQFKESNIDFGSAPIPQLGTEKQAVYANSHNFAMPASLESEEKIKGIKEFLNYVSEHSMAWAEAGQAPASKAVYESEEFKELKHQPNVAKQFDYVQFPPKVPNWGQVSKPLYEQVNLVLLGQKDAKQAMEDAAAESKQRLK
ncbi:ABC transporter substrate-binding protein [Thalassobacillus pellis]|uniref:ABC transporter substrate-binding protein n=1 Tax=Thalassobacillus pellis TaxID=748008 RepID=UPI001960DB4F|nr:ABC transporter substrate-binding protein [Thalassobacillus pellis]MBM7551468.1 multiple sugar transport system substrate-binding protein [Thalassobacillus pellis]